MIYGFIVEGTKDQRVLDTNFSNVKTINVRGTRLDNRTRMDVRKLVSECNQVFILFDPDEAGDLGAERFHKEFGLPVIRYDGCSTRYYEGSRLRHGIEYAKPDELQSFLAIRGIILTAKY